MWIPNDRTDVRIGLRGKDMRRMRRVSSVTTGSAEQQCSDTQILTTIHGDNI